MLFLPKTKTCSSSNHTNNHTKFISNLIGILLLKIYKKIQILILIFDKTEKICYSFWKRHTLFQFIQHSPPPQTLMWLPRLRRQQLFAIIISSCGEWRKSIRFFHGNRFHSPAEIHFVHISFLPRTGSFCSRPCNISCSAASAQL